MRVLFLDLDFSFLCRRCEHVLLHITQVRLIITLSIIAIIPPSRSPLSSLAILRNQYLFLLLLSLLQPAPSSPLLTLLSLL